jgi:threonine aldolase
LPFAESGRAICPPRAECWLPRSWRWSRGICGCKTRSANEAAQTIAAAAASRLVYPVEANEVFLNVSDDESARLRSQGFDFYDWGPGQIRLVTSWDSEPQAVERLASAIASL